MLYKQQKFNLLREELEGFGKLLVEVDEFLAAVPADHDDALVHQLSDRVQAIIGVFDLDPNKVVDMLFSVASQHVEERATFLLRFFGTSPWFADSVGAKSPTGQRRPTSQIIGSRIALEAQAGTNLDRSMKLLALLISHRLIDVTEIWPHIGSDIDAFRAETDRYREHLAAAMQQARGTNALTVRYRPQAPAIVLTSTDGGTITRRGCSR